MTVKTYAVREKQQFFDGLAPEWQNNFSEEDNALLRRLVAETLAALPGNDAPVLDIGCGTGVLFPYFCSRHFIGIDVSFNMLRRAAIRDYNGRWGLIQADAHTIPFADNSVAGIIGFAVAPHLDNEMRYLDEFYRVIRPGGVVSIIHLRMADEINQFHRSMGGIIGDDYLPGTEEMVSYLRRYGFTEFKVEHAGYYFILARKGNIP